MKKSVRVMLVLIALVCFGVALYYPISEYVMQKQSVDAMDRLAALRDAGLQTAANEIKAPEAEQPATEAPVTEQPAIDAPELATDKPAGNEQPTMSEPTAQSDGQVAPQPVPGQDNSEALATAEPASEETDGLAPAATTQGQAVSEAVETAALDVQQKSDVSTDAAFTPAPTVTASPTPSPTPTATPDRRVTSGAKIWEDVEKVAFDEAKILPQYRELYSINNDMVGWLSIPGTKIDYPVMQKEDEEYYLTHDFFLAENVNGLPILDHNCDPYTPSYNLVISGHNRKNNTIFSNLAEYYQDKRHRNVHPFIQFDSLMEERTYVVFAAFFAVDYNIYGEGFKYNANIEYAIDATQWINEINDNKLYETDIDVKFGDEFLTLTTCNSTRKKNGRFVVVARRVREDETFE